MYIDLSWMSSRNQFGKELNDRGLFGNAAEIGTHQGTFARILLGKWEKGRLYAIDPWATPPGYESQTKDLVRSLGSSGDRNRDYEMAKRALAQFEDRVVFYRNTSEATAVTFEDNSLDFAYLDGDHRYEAVAGDLERWWPKVRKGGIIAGHDFLCPGEKNGGWGRGIQKAVSEFTTKIGEPTVYVIAEENNLPWSYYIIKE